jgi:hypothetical protein
MLNLRTGKGKEKEELRVRVLSLRKAHIQGGEKVEAQLYPADKEVNETRVSYSPLVPAVIRSCNTKDSVR